MKKPSSTLTISNRILPATLLTIAALFAIVCLFGAPALGDTSASGSHTLTATASGQGAILPAGTVTVSEGASRAFVFAADENHRIVDVIVDGVSIGSVDAFSFENVNASHTIEAVFESKGTLTAESEKGR